MFKVGDKALHSPSQREVIIEEVRTVTYGVSFLPDNRWATVPIEDIEPIHSSNRVVTYLTDQELDILKELSIEMEMTQTDVLRKALKVYNFLVDLLGNSKDHVLTIRNMKTGLTNEVIIS